MKVDYNVVVIGAGAAGMTAAIYLKRAGISCCLLEKDAPGGQMIKTNHIENYPGFASITGPDLSMNMFKQVTNLEVPYRYGNVLEIKCEENYKVIKTETEEITCHGMIMATGRSPKKLGLPLEEALTGHGISYCATCDGPLYKGKDVVVVGGGNSALEEALYLSALCQNVTLVHRRDQFRAESELVQKVKETSNISLFLEQEVKELLEEDGTLTGVILKQKDQEQTLQCDGLFLFVGQLPNSEAFSSLGILDENGYVEADQNGKTKIPGIYAAGDILKKEVYQIATAVGEGATAAIGLIKELES